MLKSLGIPRNLSEFRLSHLADLLILVSCLFVIGFFTPRVEVALENLTELDIDLVTAAGSGTDIFNQLMWLALGALASLAVATSPQRFVRLANISWPLLAMVIVALASTLWSTEPSSTLRRAIRFAIPVYTLLVGFAYADSARRAMAIVHLAFAALLVQNFVVLPMPGAFDFFGNYTGTASSKNILGLLAAVAILIGLGSKAWLTSRIARRLNWAYLGCWALLLLMSVSKTSIALTVVMPLATACLVLLSRKVQLGVGIILLALVLTIVLFLSLSYAGFGVTPQGLLNAVQKGITFTGRTEIWEFMVEKLSGRWLLGYGFGAFWGVGDNSPNLTAKYEYIRYLKSAHNGYLDIIANVGLLGLLTLFVVVAHFSSMAVRIRERDPQMHYLAWLFMLFALSHNMMESSIYRATESPLWYLFLVAVLATARLFSEQQRALDGSGHGARTAERAGHAPVRWVPPPA